MTIQQTEKDSLLLQDKIRDLIDEFHKSHKGVILNVTTDIQFVFDNENFKRYLSRYAVYVIPELLPS